MVDVAAWLRGLGLGIYEEAFRAQAIDADVLPLLTAEDLKEIGVGPVGHRRKLLAAIAALRDGTTPASDAAAEAERRQVTVLFCDLVGSTPLAAALDPEDLREVMSAYHAAAVEAVTPLGGHIAKFLGDGILAYWGWPRALEDAGERAVRAGLALVEAVGRLCAGSGPPLQARVGIATGLVVAGDLIGRSAARAEIVGETPNLAARLQALALPGAVVVAESTRRLIGEGFACEDLGERRLKGFPAPVRAWRVIGAVAEPGTAESATPLVGREREMMWLLERWRQARGGTGQAVLLVGEAGIGKSRIADALQERIEGEACLVRRYACSPLRETSTLHPVLPELEREAGFARSDPPEARLRKLAAALGLEGADLSAVTELLGIAAGAELPDETGAARRKARALELLASHLLRGSHVRPLLLVFEDVYWADPTSQALLARLVQRAVSSSVLLLVTSRSGRVPGWNDLPHVSILPLDRLGREDGAALAAVIADGRELPPLVLERILDRADGVPLFIEELTRAVVEIGPVEMDGAAGSMPAPAIPETLQDSLMARLDRLGPAKQVAPMAAVIGQSFPLELLRAVLPWSPHRLQEALAALVAAGLVRRLPEEDQPVYAFRHALIREVAYETLLRERRRQLHARVAEALRQRFPGTPPELLAQHLARAGAVREAAWQWLEAGELALRQAATSEAMARLEAGLDLAAALPPDDPDRRRLEARLQLAIGQVLSLARGRAAPEVGRAFERAYELSWQEDEAAPVPTAALLGLYGFHFLRAELNEARIAADELLRRAEWQGDAELLVAARAIGGSITFFLGRLAEAEASLGAALADEAAMRRSAFDTAYGFQIRLSSLAYRCSALLVLGHPDQARARSRAMLCETAIPDREPGALAVVLFSDGMMSQLLRDSEAVRDRAEALLALAREHDLSLWRAGAAILHGRSLADRGELAAGIRSMRQGIAAWRATGAEHLVPYFQALLAEACARAGRPAEGLRLLEDALARTERTGERWCEAELLRLRGELLLLRAPRHRAAAEASLHRARAIAARQHARWWELRAAVSLARLVAGHDGVKARRLLAPVFDRFTEGFATPDLREAKAILEQPDPAAVQPRRH
ncbi:ATP-binding protein [Benzoatithermus flavus]|uniref:Adenylate/guanylate cyclase domain-containing protein n=1 Tax=Benzoatithermus flavus TaxID=3108223 RepID=A0ABU8XSG1_9PROT